MSAKETLPHVVDEAAEPRSEEDWAEIRAGEAAIAGGEFTPLDDLKRELGL